MIAMKQFPFIALVFNILINSISLGFPVAQLLLPQYPQFINYIYDSKLPPGGTPQSILSANFTPGQIVVSDGNPSYPSDTGTAGALSMLGNTLAGVGRGLGSSLGTLVQGEKKNLVLFNLRIFK